MIKVLGILFSALELVGFALLVYMAYARYLFGLLVLCVVLLGLSAFGFVLRLRERSVAVEITDAEDKLTKRVLRRIAKGSFIIASTTDTKQALIAHVTRDDVLREAIQKEVQRQKQSISSASQDTVSHIIAQLTEGGILRDAVQREVQAQIVGADVQRIVRTFVGDALVKAAQSEK